MSERPEWFSAKRHGYGTAMPCSWQGWVVTAAYFAIAIGCALLFAERPLILMSIFIPATAIFLATASKTTRGGLRWGGGDKE
jgi:hypothetical protein